MKAEGFKLISKREIDMLLNRKDKTITLQDALQSLFPITKSFYYHYHSDLTTEDTYKIVYEVITPFSES